MASPAEAKHSPLDLFVDERLVSDTDADTGNNDADADADNGAEDDDDTASRDSGFAEDEEGALSTRSMTSSVLNYRHENGRRYNAFRHGQYYMPNDEHEQDCMDLFHHVCGLLLGGDFYCAPVVEPQNVLDVGTGTGIWAIDFADKFPMAAVIGIDLSPIQPSWIPPNLEFLVEDCETDWTSSRSFDFIHARNMAGSIADWPTFLRNAYNSLQPGGWIEVADIGFPASALVHGMPAESPSMEFNRLVIQATEASGRPLDINYRKQDMLIHAGFVQVQTVVRRVPASHWMSGSRNRELATFHQPLLLGEIEGMSLLLFTRELGWNIEELQVLLAAVRNDYKNPALKMYQDMMWVYARKPEAEQ